MDQATDKSGPLQDPKQQQSTTDLDRPFRLAPVRAPRAVDWRSPRSLRLPRMPLKTSQRLFSVHGQSLNVSGLGDDSEPLSGLESCKVKTRTDGTHPDSQKATESLRSASNGVNTSEDIPKSPETTAKVSPTPGLAADVDSIQSSEGNENPTRLCNTCKKQKDQIEFHDRRFRNIKYTKNCLECREEARSRKRKRPKRRSGRGKLEKEKEGSEALKASAKEAHNEEDSAVEPEARDNATDDSETDNTASVAPTEKRRLPAGFDDQGPKKHARASELPTTSDQPKTTTQMPKASEPPTLSEQPATEENFKDLGTPENHSLAPETKGSEQPKAVKPTEPAEKVASSATVDQQRPAEPETTHGNLRSHGTVETGHEAEPLRLRGSDGPDNTRAGPSSSPGTLSPWSVAYDRSMPFTEAEFEQGRAYLLQGTTTAAPRVHWAPTPVTGPEERLARAQRCLVHYLGAALPELRDRLHSASWCLRARRWLQYAGELERVALYRARAEHPLLTLVVGDVAKRRRFRAALGQVVLDLADRDGLGGGLGLAPRGTGTERVLI